MKKAFLTVLVTLAVILTCGGLLAILSDVLAVSEEERIARAIEKIYVTDAPELQSELNVSDFDLGEEAAETGVVKKAYLLTNGQYLILVTGKKGYSNGTVTLYVSVYVDGGTPTVGTTALDSYGGQTLMAKLTDLYPRFAGYTEVGLETAGSDLIVTGASKSSTAANNAVKTALRFVSAVIGG